jgi:hypothetical protein
LNEEKQVEKYVFFHVSLIFILMEDSYIPLPVSTINLLQYIISAGVNEDIPASQRYTVGKKKEQHF